MGQRRIGAEYFTRTVPTYIHPYTVCIQYRAIPTVPGYRRGAAGTPGRSSGMHAARHGTRISTLELSSSAERSTNKLPSVRHSTCFFPVGVRRETNMHETTRSQSREAAVETDSLRLRLLKAFRIYRTELLHSSLLNSCFHLYNG
jgi:hypothetical protein